LLQPRLSDSLELEEQLVPSHLPLPQRTRSEWMWHREHDKLVNAMWMGRRREPRRGGSPVVANDVRCVDTERVENADHIAGSVLQGIRAYSFGAIGASESTQVRRDRMEAVIDEEWDLVAPEICRSGHKSAIN
jgi:hypothetical protein